MIFNKYFSALAVVLFLFFLNACAQTAVAPQQKQSIEPSLKIPETPVDTKAPQENLTKKFSLVVKNKKLVSGPEVLQVNQNDQVEITIISDEEEELHLHGYDKSVKITKDLPAQLSITADISGRFEYELEKSGMELGALEVQPQ